MPSLHAAVVAPGRRVQGSLRVPGDKSIAHRYAILAALADGASRLTHFAPGADCRSTLTSLEGLGIPVHVDNDSITLHGRGLGRLRSPTAPLDAGNSGSTMRMLAGVVAGHEFETRLVGDASLSRRPMRRVIQPLEQMGARFDATEGHAPLVVHGTRLHGIHFHPSVPSAQVKSAVLLAGLLADGETSVTEPAQTRDHTECAMRAFGLAPRMSGLTVSVTGGQALLPQTLDIPGDFSSAAFWLVAAAALPGSRVEILDVGLNPTRTGLLDVLRRFGAHVSVDDLRTEAGEPRGTIRVEAGLARRIEITAADVPGVIDELPAIAALAAHGGEVAVSGASELRVKESDRIAVLVAGFRALGIDADERDDGFVVHGSGSPAGGAADARGDHRMAMAFAIAALAAQGPSRIDGADAVAISYPEFFSTLERLMV